VTSGQPRQAGLVGGPNDPRPQPAAPTPGRLSWRQSSRSSRPCRLCSPICADARAAGATRPSRWLWRVVARLVQCPCRRYACRRADLYGLRPGQDQPIAEFTRNKGTPWTHARCKPCRARRARKATWAQLPEAEGEREQRYLQRTSISGTTRAPRSDSKRCSGCGEVKLLTEFTPIRSRPGKHYPSCKLCRNAKARARYYSNPEIHAAEIARSWRNKRLRRARAPSA
jgi:hypothetical protein